MLLDSTHFRYQTRASGQPAYIRGDMQTSVSLRVVTENGTSGVRHGPESGPDHGTGRSNVEQIH